MKVLMINNPVKVHRDFLKRARETGADCLLGDYKTDAEKIQAGSGADFILTYLGNYPFNRYVLEHLPGCKFIETLGVGYNGIDLEAAAELGIGVIHHPGLCSEELSDHAMALILACSRWVVGLNSRVRAANPVVSASFDAVQHLGTLRGKTLGIIGFGNSARCLVPKAAGFGMKVLFYDPYVDEAVAGGMNVGRVNLNSLLAESDFISIHASLTPTSLHLLGIEQIKKMKRSAFLVNTARGAIINEKELCLALSKNYIAGAGLDVTDPEPISPDNPLLKLDNVILTGHNAGGSPECYERMWSFPIEQIKRVMRKQWPDGLVNPEVKPVYTKKWGSME
jgi:D-3-phosphoglycerate dehydrogenase / 2-oxoglutarate reductase